MKRFLNFFVLIAFCFSSLSSYAQASSNVPVANLLPVSQSISHAALKGVKVNPDNPFDLKFIIDTNNDKTINKEEAQTLVNYFFAGLTLPEQDLWVNLSPYEQNRIIPDTTATTELGVGLLKEDYLLKQLASSLTYPETELGKKYWNDVNGVGARSPRPGQGNPAPTNTFSKVWIVPDKALIYENGNSAFITQASLKVQNEENNPAFRENILPAITQQVNQGEHFSQLRQIYNALILGVWFKNKLKDSIYKNYIAQSKTNGIDNADTQAREKIYQQYLNAFKQGAYNYIKSTPTQYVASRKISKRAYFSGGIGFGAGKDGLGANVRATAIKPVSVGLDVEVDVEVLHPAVQFKRGVLGLLADRWFGSYKGRTSEAMNAYIAVLKKEGARLAVVESAETTRLLHDITEMALPGNRQNLTFAELPRPGDVTVWVVDTLPAIGEASALLRDHFEREGGLEAAIYPITNSGGRYAIFVLRNDYTKKLVMAHEFVEVKRRMLGDKPDQAHDSATERVGYGTKNEVPLGDSDVSANSAASTGRREIAQYWARIARVEKTVGAAFLLETATERFTEIGGQPEHVMLSQFKGGWRLGIVYATKHKRKKTYWADLTDLGSQDKEEIAAGVSSFAQRLMEFAQEYRERLRKPGQDATLGTGRRASPPTYSVYEFQPGVVPGFLAEFDSAWRDLVIIEQVDKEAKALYERTQQYPIRGKNALALVRSVQVVCTLTQRMRKDLGTTVSVTIKDNGVVEYGRKDDSLDGSFSVPTGDVVVQMRTIFGCSEEREKTISAKKLTEIMTQLTALEEALAGRRAKREERVLKVRKTADAQRAAVEKFAHTYMDEIWPLVNEGVGEFAQQGGINISQTEFKVEVTIEPDNLDIAFDIGNSEFPLEEAINLKAFLRGLKPVERKEFLQHMAQKLAGWKRNASSDGSQSFSASATGDLTILKDLLTIYAGEVAVIAARKAQDIPGLGASVHKPREAGERGNVIDGGIKVTKDTINLKTTGKGNDFKINDNTSLDYATLIPQVVLLRDLPKSEFSAILER